MGGYKDVYKEQPKDGEYVLCICWHEILESFGLPFVGKFYIHKGYYPDGKDDFGIVVGGRCTEATHWQPLPRPTKARSQRTKQ